MKKRTITALIICLLWGVSTSAATYYVSADGDDSDPGTEGQPFATINKAKNVIVGTTGNTVEIMDDGGVFYLAEPVDFNELDSGASGAVNLYRAQPGDTPVISGGTLLTPSWSVEAGDVYKTSVGATDFYTLWVDGVRATRAKEPDSGTFTVVSAASSNISFTFDDTLPDIDSGWTDLTDVEVICWSSSGWIQSRQRISTVDGTLVTLADTRTQAYDYLGHTYTYFCENCIDFLDTEGEWYLDTGANVLYYWAIGGGEPTGTFVAGNLGSSLVSVTDGRGVNALYDGWIMSVKGQSGDFVEYINIDGLTFRQSDWTLPAYGYAGHQSAWQLEYSGDGAGIGPAASFVYATQCKLLNCTIEQTGGHGLTIMGDHITISRCTINNTGANGIRVGTNYGSSNVDEITNDNTFEDNTIHDVGKVYAEGTGILIQSCEGNLITHNDVYDVSYNGISVGWDWTARDYVQGGNTISYNDVYNTNSSLRDGAGIYTLSYSPGTTVRNNKVNNSGASGIYHDEHSEGIVTSNNWIYDCDSGIYLHDCNNCTLDNNVIVDAAWASLVYQTANEVDNVQTHNVVSNETGNGDILFKNYNLNVGTSDYNLFYGSVAWDDTGTAMDMTEWLAAYDFDDNSSTSDPDFVDRNNDDYNVNGGSPALGVGFVNFSMANVGPRDTSVRYFTF